MKYERYQQFLTVKADAPEIFTEDLNKAIYELRTKSPVVHFSETDPLCAYISYTEHYQSPETLADVYELQGVRFTCEMCPIFSPIRKKDGTIDKRLKIGDCPECKLLRTYKDSPACVKLYQMLRDGRVRLIKAEDEEEEEA